MAFLRDWFNKQRDILLSRYQLPSIQGICPAFNLIDYWADELDLTIKMEYLSPKSHHNLHKIQTHIQYETLPIPDQTQTSYLNEHMNSLETKLDFVDEEIVDTIDELLSKPAGGEE